MREGKPWQQEGMGEPQSEFHEALAKFYSGRIKAPEAFTYTDAGDLVGHAVSRKKGGVIEIGKEELRITLPNYRSLTTEERDTQEGERKARIEEAEGVFETARKELRELLERKKAANVLAVAAGANNEEGDIEVDDLALEIVIKNMEVQAADSALQAARYPLRLFDQWERVPRPLLFIDDSRQEKKVPEVNIFRTRPFTLQTTYVRTVEGGEGGVVGGKRKKRAIDAGSVAGVAVAGAGAGASVDAGGEIIRVRVVLPMLEKNINAFLNPWFPAPIIYKGQGYLHAYQAAMAGTAELLGDAAAAAQIRAATTPEAMTYKPKESISPETYNRVLAEVLFATTDEKFKQNPELGVRLLQTGMDRIVIVPPGDSLDTVLGTGLDVASPNIKDVSKWTGQNRLGFYIEQVRQRRRDARAAEQAAAAAALEAGAPAAGILDTAAAATATVAGAFADATGAAIDAATDALGLGEDEEEVDEEDEEVAEAPGEMGV